MEIKKASENIFEDLNLPNPIALKARLQLLNQLVALMELQGETQVQYADILGISPHAASRLYSRKISYLTIETLVGYAAKLGYHAHITLSEVADST